MNYTRRDFGKFAMSAAPAAAGLSGLVLPGLMQAAPDSKIDGVQVGTITYSFRQGVDKLQLPQIMAKIGLSEVELMSGDAEIIAGMPSAGGGGFGGGAGRGASGRGGGGGGRGAANAALAPNGCPANSPSGQDAIRKAAGTAGAAAGGRGGGRGPLTPEQEAAQKAIADWKMAANASTWKGVRKKFNDAGVDVQILCYNMGNAIKDD